MYRYIRAGALLAGGLAAGIALVISCGVRPSSSQAQTMTKFVTADTDGQQLRLGSAPKKIHQLI